MAKESLSGFVPSADDQLAKLHDRERIQKWLELKKLPSERFAEGLIAVIGHTVLELGARGRMSGLAIVAGPIIADTIDAAAAAFVREYFARFGSYD